jgi:hypothetical protein
MSKSAELRKSIANNGKEGGWGEEGVGGEGLGSSAEDPAYIFKPVARKGMHLNWRA